MINDYVEFSEYMIKPPKGARRTAWGYFWPGQSMAGYGKKITTEYMIKPEGVKRFYRVYATCYGNCSSLWVASGGHRYCLHDTAFDMAREVQGK